LVETGGIGWQMADKNAINLAKAMRGARSFLWESARNFLDGKAVKRDDII